MGGKDQDHLQGKRKICKKAKWLSEEDLKIPEKKKKEEEKKKAKEKRKIYRFECRIRKNSKER